MKISTTTILTCATAASKNKNKIKISFLFATTWMNIMEKIIALHIYWALCNYYIYLAMHMVLHCPFATNSHPIQHSNHHSFLNTIFLTTAVHHLTYSRIATTLFSHHHTLTIAVTSASSSSSSTPALPLPQSPTTPCISDFRPVHSLAIATTRRMISCSKT